MKVAIASGKGGTGKTTIAACVAVSAAVRGLSTVYVDCDVEAPNGHLLLRPTVERRQTVTRLIPTVDMSRCDLCGACERVCQFGAIICLGSTVQVQANLCKSCGACVAVCDSDAIRFEPATNGQWMVSRTRFGPMVHARLHPGAENSGKLVSVVRREARQEAAEADIPLVLIDGSPGIGCPVIASLTGADLAPVVAEPTQSALHDARRVIELARQLHVPAVVCINRWDVNPALAARVKAEAAVLGASVVGRVREDRAMVQAQMRAVTLIEHTDRGAAVDVHRLWDELFTLIRQPQDREQPCPS